MTWPYDPYSPQPQGDPNQQPDAQPYAPPSAPAGYTSQQYGQQPSVGYPPSQQPYPSPYQGQHQSQYQGQYQTPYPGQYPGQYQTPYLSPYLTPPPRRHSRALPWFITLGVLAFVALMVAVAVLVYRQNHQTCGAERAPFGASAAAVAYVRAVNASTPEWMSMSSTIQSQDYKVRPEQMVLQLQADEKFVTALKGIAFSPAQQPAAQALITSVEQYDAFVQTASENPGYLNAHQAEDRTLNDNRAAASSELRRVLRLPLSRCTYNRP